MSDEGMEPYGTVVDQSARPGHRSRLAGAAAMLLVTGIGGGFAVGWASRGSPRGSTSVASPAVTGVPSMAMGASGATVPGPYVLPLAAVPSGTAYVGTVWASPAGVVNGSSIAEKFRSLGRWTTPDGITIRAYQNSFPTGQGVATAQCSPTAVVTVELSDLEAVTQTGIPLYSNGGQKTAVVESSVWGLTEGAPAAWAVISTDPSVNKVSVSFDGGATYAVKPVDGVAIAASRLKAVPPGGITGTVVASGSGRTTTLPLKALRSEPVMTPACLPRSLPPTTVAPMPSAGVQPADPAAARTAVTKAIGIVFGGEPAPDPFQYVQGATASVKAAQKTAADNNPTAHTSTNVEQIVFTSPTTGAVRYQLLDNGSPVLDPISQVVLDGGIWKVTTTSACAAYALGGGHC